MYRVGQNAINWVVGEARADLAARRPEVDVPAATLQGYVGVYRLSPSAKFELFEDGDRLRTPAAGKELSRHLRPIRPRSSRRASSSLVGVPAGSGRPPAAFRAHIKW